MSIAPGATWQVGFRPTHMKVTYTCPTAPLDFVSLGTWPGCINFAFKEDYFSEEVIEINVTEDIGCIQLFEEYGGQKIYKIEFYR